MYFVLDDNNNKVPAYSAEEVLALLNKAIADGTLANIVADAAFISKVKCCVSGDTHLFAFVTQAKLNELKANNQTINNCYYFITDDTTADDINEKLEKINEKLKEIDKMPKRIYEYTGDWGNVLSNGLTSYNVSNYIGNKSGYFKVIIKYATLLETVELIAMNNSITNICGTNGEIAKVMIAEDNMIIEGGSIVAVDYYEAL